MKTILALILLATLTQGAIVEDDVLEFPGADIVLESINIEVDWVKLVACIKAAHPMVKDVVALVQLVTARNMQKLLLSFRE